MADPIDRLWALVDDVTEGLKLNGVVIDEQDRAVVFNAVSRLLAAAESRATRAEQDASIATVAALTAIVELDSIRCPPFAPCEAPVERAIAVLLELCPGREAEDWSAVKALDEARAKLSQHAQHVASRR